MASEILIERRGEGRALITINRPHRRNACDFAAWTDLKSALDAADRQALGLNAPPDGLYFVSATYP